jgi:hypothetical protein
MFVKRKCLINGFCSFAKLKKIGIRKKVKYLNFVKIQMQNYTFLAIRWDMRGRWYQISTSTGKSLNCKQIMPNFTISERYQNAYKWHFQSGS